MKPIDFEQGTPEWLAARMGFATGSRFDDVMSVGTKGEAAGKTEYRTELALELNGIKKAFFVNDAMKQGIEREPLAREEYEKRTMEFIDLIGFCLHDTLRCGVSPDGLLGANGLVEFKCPQPNTHFAYMNRKDMPPKYKWQVQGQLWVMEREWCDFVSYSSDFPHNAQLIVRRTYRDEKLIAALAAEIEPFMESVHEQAETIRLYREANFNEETV